jgi:hypothetical protein
MKRIYIAIGVLILMVALFFALRLNPNRTGNIDPQLLRLKNPKSVTKILLTPNNKKQSYIILYKDDKNEGRWMVKNEQMTELADTHSIRELLFWAMSKIVVKNPVSDGEKENVTRDMKFSSIKAVFYNGDEEVHTIYAGNPTPSQEATYMYHTSLERPVVASIDGFKGYLTPYFTVDFDAWRSPVMIDLPAEKIKRIKVEWPQNPQTGFEIVKKDGVPSLLNNKGQTVAAPEARLLSYLERFQNLCREYGETAGINRKPSTRDSILAAGHFFALEVEGTDGKKNLIRLYKMAASSETYAPVLRDGTTQQQETETFWVQMNNKKELWVIQGSIIKSRMKSLSDFINQAGKP